MRLAGSFIITLLVFLGKGEKALEWNFGTEATWKVERAGEGLEAIVDFNAKLMRLATGFQFTEGPVYAADGFLLFSDIPPQRIYRLDLNGQLSVFREQTGNGNGNCFDPKGHLLTCEGANKRVTRMNLKTNHLEVLASEYEGKPLNQPNDIIATRDGRIYFTDPVFGDLRLKTQPVEGVYLIRPDGSLVRIIADEKNQPKPNGLALSPDGKTLYTTDSQRNVVRAYSVNPDGTVSNGRDLGRMEGKDGAGDGMRVDENGNIYATGPDGLWIFAPDGRLLGHLILPEVPANCAFGGEKRDLLFLTARTSVYLLKVKVRGAPSP
ncbi:MAG: SMP-30/gluconolactonase/LRE family protein [Armatimonadetes bacterium]|nr:SMP-30/gluconolactonase/LRE family protein [Armatimonadota bacterium]MDW8120946.1 SMP-30/gluconolactonase/LRE family protein [Armatimonadota bacterium]